MKITIEGKWGDDFPEELKSSTAFVDSLATQVRKKLALRPQDTVIVRVVE